LKKEKTPERVEADWLEAMPRAEPMAPAGCHGASSQSFLSTGIPEDTDH
jgi:hypothetical protein